MIMFCVIVKFTMIVIIVINSIVISIIISCFTVVCIGTSVLYVVMIITMSITIVTTLVLFIVMMIIIIIIICLTIILIISQASQPDEALRWLRELPLAGIRPVEATLRSGSSCGPFPEASSTNPFALLTFYTLHFLRLMLILPRPRTPRPSAPAAAPGGWRTASPSCARWAQRGCRRASTSTPYIYIYI